MYIEFAVVAIFIFAYSVVAGRIEKSVVSGPIIFVAAGFILGPLGLRLLDGETPDNALRILADLTLATFLFIDAAGANFDVLRKQFTIPGRMLLIGLPGAMLLGAIAAGLFFGSLTIFEAAILGIMLAATDAALGKPVITNRAVPARLRESLNIESGLNDGLCVPFLLVFISLAAGANGHGEGGVGLALQLVAQELGIGLLVGVLMTLVASTLISWCRKRGWLSKIWIQATAPALAIACFAVAQSVHGSGYIAAFVGGLTFGLIMKDDVHDLVHAAEGLGETLALMTWLLFGAVVVGQSFEYFTWPMLIYAVLSLTLFRMLPIFLSLAGTGEVTRTKLFLGWFGPRGLASIVFAIIVVNSEVPGARFLAMVVVLTVFLSLVLHGVSANPLAKWIAAKEAAPPDGESSQAVASSTTRL